MSWLVLYCAIQAGVCPDCSIVTYPPQAAPLFYPGSGYMSFDAELRMFNGHLFLGGWNRTEFQKDVTNWTFTPHMAGFGAKAGIRWGAVETGFTYCCEHPILPYFDVYHPVINWDGWYSELYVKVSGELKVF